MNSPQPKLYQAWLRHPWFNMFITVGLSIGLTYLISTLLLNVPGSNQQQMVITMSGTGIIMTVLVYALYRLNVLQRIGSLRLTLSIMSLITSGIILINVWILSQLMFVDSHYVSLTGTVLIFTGLIALTFSYFISKAMTDRLSDLSEASACLARGELTTRLDVKGNDEIAHLTETFNLMATRLQEIDDQKKALEQIRRDLIAWVSHDLRTPLTSMRVMLEAMNDGIITDEETQKRYIQTSLTEIAHLNTLINDLFEMAKLDVGHIQLEYQPTSISDLISDTIGSMSAKAQKKSIKITGSVETDDDIVNMATDKIQRVLYNLVQNAILYTPQNETINITAKQTNQIIQIDVQNTGVTIDKDTLPKLFESFYRGEKSRAKNEDDERGTGLGLAIARGIIEAHGGEIWATSDEATGTTFSFTIPTNTKVTAI